MFIALSQMDLVENTRSLTWSHYADHVTQKPIGQYLDKPMPESRPARFTTICLSAKIDRLSQHGSEYLIMLALLSSQGRLVF